MDDRQTILNRIYKTCFCRKDIEEAFKQEWKYIYNILEKGWEDCLSQEILNYINTWIDAII